MRNISCLILLTTLIIFPLSGNAQHIVINEILASNQLNLQDMDGNSSDWIELYNPTSEVVSLLDHSLTDDQSNIREWVFPDIALNPGAFLLVWASNKDRKDAQELHTSFKLSKSGEFLGLFDENGVAVDSLRFGEQSEDVSYGRNPDAGDQWSFFTQPTPGASNNGSAKIVEIPQFSHEQGYYNNPLTISLSTGNHSLAIFYTLNGNLPDTLSQRYMNPITIDTTTSVRAVCFDSNGNPSLIVTNTYLINEKIQLPILSIVTDNANLYDEEIGIFFNDYKAGPEWERPASVSYFKKENGLEFTINAGIRIHGSATRSSRKKSFRLYFRNEYGQSELDYQIFDSKELSHFKRLILRMGGQDHNMYSASWSLIRCPLLQRLHSEQQPTFSTSRPVMLFLNGRLWGIYYFRERVDKYYLEDNFTIQDADLNKSTWKWGGETIEGDREHWDRTFQFFKMNNLGVPENMATARELVNVENFTDHNIFNIFGANWDWPQNNVYKFRNRESNGKWHWIMWDVDAIFGRSTRARYPTWNAMEWATREEVRLDLNYSDTENLLWSTEMLRSLLKSAEYREYFINRFADLLNTTLQPNHIVQVIDSLAAVIEPDYELEATRWDVTKERWLENVASLKAYIIKRHDQMFKHIKAYFRTGKVYSLTVVPKPGNGGTVKVSTIHLKKFPWSGFYFGGLPYKVVALPEPGFTFIGWTGDIHADADSTILIMNRDMTIFPVFREDTTFTKIVINEINYNSSQEIDTEDWIEFYNNSTSKIDLSGWVFSDSEDTNTFIFPQNTVLEQNDYLILTRDSLMFRNYFPGISNCLGNFDFGFSGGGELIRLFNSNAELIDYVTYDDKPPWPTEADGNGPTLELISPDLDNSIAENWQVSEKFGTPGLSNNSSLDPVPVTLVYFRVVDCTGDKICLEWRTESETNNWGFFVERKIDGGKFKTIDFIKGKGTTAIPQFYTYEDADIESNAYIYRLRQMDFDGMVHYSEELQTALDVPHTFIVRGCYPNPFNNFMTLSIFNPVDSDAEVFICNIRGEFIKLLMKGKLKKGRHNLTWDGTDYAHRMISSGIYLINIKFQDQIKTVKTICLK